MKGREKMFKKLWNALVSIFNKKKEEAVTNARTWTEEQIEELKKLYTSGVAKEKICEITGRSLSGVNNKLIEIFGTSKAVK